MDEDDEYKKPSTGVWVVWSLIVAQALLFVLIDWFGDNKDKYVIIQTFVLALTLLILAWYAYWTLQMQRTMVRQTTISIMPLFNIAIVIKYGVREPWDASSRYNVFLQNIGNGVGVNIEIDPLYVKHDSDGVEATDKLMFRRVVHLSPKDNPIFLRDFVEFDEYLKQVMVTDKVRPDLVAFLMPDKIKGEYELKLRYMDLLGNGYVQTIHVDERGCWPGIAVPDNLSNKKATASHR